VLEQVFGQEFVTY